MGDPPDENPDKQPAGRSLAGEGDSLQLVTAAPYPLR